MAKKNTLQERMIGERVRAMAIVYLTRRPEITIHEETKEIGIDLLAFITPEHKAGVRQFGVELKGIWEDVNAEQANRTIRPKMREMQRQGPFPFPVLLFFFTMEKNRRWYTWVAEPLLSPQDGVELPIRREADCRPLDNKAVDEIVTRVNAWYDAYYMQVGSLVGSRA
ncbi:MAG: hypothetical protein ACLQGP_25845 [Isosphaeraceae bacterium]